MFETLHCVAPLCMWGRSSVVRAPAAKAAGPVFDPRQLPWFFFFSSSWLTNVDEIEVEVNLVFVHDVNVVIIIITQKET